MRKHRLFTTVAGSLAMVVAHSSSEAVLSSMKSFGMGGTSCCYPVDAFAGVYNPAGITAIPDRIDMGLYWIQRYQRSKIHDLPTYPPFVVEQTHLQPSRFNDSWDASKTPNTYAAEFAIKKGWCKQICNRNVELAASFNIHNHDYQKTTYGRPVPLLGTTPMGGEIVIETASMVFASKICNMHSFGLSVNFNVQRLKIDGFQNIDNPLQSQFPGYVTNRGYSYSNGWGVTLGYLFEWNNLKAGLSWRPKTSMKNFNKYKGFIPEQGSVDIPEALAGGISYRLFNCVTVAGEARYTWYHKEHGIGNATFPEFKEGTNPRDYLFGGKFGPGTAFRNELLYRAGLEYEIDPCYAVRAGFIYSKTPIPRDSTFGNFHTIFAKEALLTFGGTWKFRGCQEFSIVYINGFTHKIKGKNSIPPTIHVATPGGLVEVPINDQLGPQGFTGESAGGEADLKQRVCALGVAYGYTF